MARVRSAPSPTLSRFLELLDGTSLDPDGARAVLRELKAVGGDLRELRLALTGTERGPALRDVLVTLGSEEAARRARAALASV